MKVKHLGPLEAARESKGWSQSKLSARSGVHQGNISAYEKGSIPLGIAAAKKLGNALDADPTLLVIHSQITRLETAIRNKDLAAALLALKSIVETIEGGEPKSYLTA